MRRNLMLCLSLPVQAWQLQTLVVGAVYHLSPVQSFTVAMLQG